MAAIGFGTAAAGPTCTIYWTGKTSGNWATSTNWSLTNGGASAGRVPKNTDFVCMSTTPTTSTVTLASGTVTVAGISWGQAGTVQPSLTVNGTLILGSSQGVDASSLDHLVINGTLTNFKNEAATAADLSFQGILNGPGTLTVSGPATLNAGELGAGGTAAHLVLQGATTAVSGISVYFFSGSELENQGTLTLQDGADLLNDDGNANNELVNDAAGTVTYTGSDSTQTATASVNAANNGTVSVGVGTLTYGAGGTAVNDFGTFTAAAGARLDVAGTRTEGTGATVGGAGTVDVTGSATFTSASNLTNSGTFQVDGTLSVASGINVSAANLTLNGTVAGPGTLTVTGPATLNNNANLGVYNTTGSGVHLVLKGATTAAPSPYILFNGGSELENQGTLTLQDGTYLYDQDGLGNQLVNDSGGTVTYTGSDSTQTATVGVNAANKGTVSVAVGTLSYGAGGTTVNDSGTFTAAAGATLAVAGTRTEGTGATVGGAGTVDVTGSATFTSASNLTNSGTFQVDGTLAVASGINVTTANLTLNGNVQGPGTLTVTGPATLNSGANLGVYATPANAAHLVLKGASTVTANVQVTLYGGSELENQGTLTLQDGSYLYDYDGDGSQVVNDSGATIAYAGSDSSQSATINLTAVNNGTVNANKGTLSFGGGSSAVTDAGAFNAAAGAVLDVNGARTEGTGATIGGAGTVDVTGSATFTAASNLTNSGTFQVDGTLAVASGMNVTTANLTLNGNVRRSRNADRDRAGHPQQRRQSRASTRRRPTLRIWF